MQNFFKTSKRLTGLLVCPVYAAVYFSLTQSSSVAINYSLNQIKQQLSGSNQLQKQIFSVLIKIFKESILTNFTIAIIRDDAL